MKVPFARDEDQRRAAIRIEVPSMKVLRVSSLRRRVSGLRCSLHFRSFKQPSRWLARFTRECERDSLVTTFYPCRHSLPITRCCMRPKRARRTGCGRNAPSIRTVALSARPRKFTGASTNLQRCSLLSSMDWILSLQRCRDEPCALGDHTILEVAPQRDQQSPRQGNDADAAHARAGAGEARLIPLGQRALWLEA